VGYGIDLSGATVIHPHNTETLNRWNRGELRVQLDIPGRRQPMGYCDGSAEDEAELRAMAEEEGVEDLPIHRKILKTGREIWTVGNPSEASWE
jgi:hypothetical protein